MSGNTAKNPATKAKAESAPEPEENDSPELLTAWANTDGDTVGFDHDQAAVHAWTEAMDHNEKSTMEILETKMTIADVEELIYTCGKMMEEHVARARSAELLAERLATRLGRPYADMNTVKITKAPAQAAATPKPAPILTASDSLATKVQQAQAEKAERSIPGFLE